MERDVLLDLKLIVKIIKKKLATILLIPLTSVLISTILSIFILPDVYEAKTTIIIGRASTGDKTIQYDEILMYEKIVKTYSEIARSRLVAEKTLQNLNKNVTIESFLDKIVVSQESDTQIMSIRIRASNPQDAMIMTNMLTDIFIKEAERLYPVANIQIIDRAYPPQAPISPNIKLNNIVALCFGVVISSGVIFISRFDNNPSITAYSSVEPTIRNNTRTQ